MFDRCDHVSCCDDESGRVCLRSSNRIDSNKIECAANDKKMARLCSTSHDGYHTVRNQHNVTCSCLMFVMQIRAQLISTVNSYDRRVQQAYPL